MTLQNRIEEKIYYEPNTGCWLWAGACGTAGYGSINVCGRTEGAHRASYAIHKGPIPNRLLVLHTCDVRICVNPDHLFLGTHQDNMDDMTTKGRHAAPKGQNHGMAKLTDGDVSQIRAMLIEGNETQAAIGEKFGVSSNLIHYIKTGKLWANHTMEGHSK